MSGNYRQNRILAAIKTSDGSVVQPDESGYVTLTAATYVFMLGGSEGDNLESIHLMTDAAIAWSGSYVETCNLPRNTEKVGTARSDAVTDYSTTTGEWIKEDPTTAYVATTGTGWTVTNATCAKTAGAGGAMYHVGNMGAARVRYTIVCTTGGKVRVAGCSKS